MRSGRSTNRLLFIRSVILFVTVGTLTACQSSNTTDAGNSATSPCVTVVTTIPGEVFCEGYDPEVELSNDPESGETASECPLDVPANEGRPDDGWLGTETSGATQQLNVMLDPQPAPGHPDRIRLADAAKAAVPSGFKLVVSDATGDLRCPDTPIVINAILANDNGEEISVYWTRLRSQIEWFNEPIRGEVERSRSTEGIEVVANDFDELGQKHRVWAAKPDGSVIKVIVAGTNAPSQYGWPTTTTRFDDDIPEAQPAPLTLAESVDLALKLLE